MNILWITDPHFNFLRPELREAFALDVADHYPNLNAVVLTGDLAEHASFQELTEEFAQTVGKPVYFVLGNHDSYGSSIHATKEKARSMTGLARWLPAAGLIQVTEDTVLCGVDGWYDAKNGSGWASQVLLNDFTYISELNTMKPHLALQDVVNAEVQEAEATLAKAVASGAKNVVFATHVPPFPQATWHEGKHSDAEWLPWMSCQDMGSLLYQIAESNRSVNFTVLCGHTHGSGNVQLTPNLKVFTGASRYGRPEVSKYFEGAFA